MSSKKKKQEKKKIVHRSANASKNIVKNTEERRLIRILAGIVAAIAIIEYIQTLNYEFVMDDYSAIVENFITKGGIHSIPEIFKTTYRFGYAIQGDELYRPIPKSVFAILWQISPNNPLPLHFLNVLLYAFTGFLLFITLVKFLPQNIYACFIASALWIAHPVHTEVVDNIKSMDEILSFLFFVVSLYYLEKFFESGKKRWMFIALVGYFASLLSKESAITYLAVYPLVIFFFTKKPAAKNFQIVGLMVIPAILFLIIRYKIVPAGASPSSADNILLTTKDLIIQKASAIYFLGFYLKQLILPLTLTFDYSYNQLPLVNVSDWKFIVSAIVYLLLLIIVLMRWKKKDLVAFGILFYLITISISSNVFMMIGTHMAERLLFVPSFGFCFAVAALMQRFLPNAALQLNTVKSFFQSRMKLTTLIVVITGLYILKTWAQNPSWTNNVTLFESGVQRSPKSYRTHYYLGNYLLKKEYYESFPEKEKNQIVQRGLAELRTATMIYPHVADLWLHIGTYYYQTTQLDSAEFYFLKALEVDLHLATAHNNLGTVYYDEKKYGAAIDQYMAAARDDPNYHEAFLNLGSVYGTVGKFSEAIPYFKRALELGPGDASNMYYLGVTYRSLGDMQNAKYYLDKAAELDPKFRK